MAKTQSVIVTPVQADSSGQIVVPVYYRVSSSEQGDPASVLLAGVGSVILFDNTKLRFDGYEASIDTDLYQAPTEFPESALRGSLETSSGRDFSGIPNGEIDGNSNTNTGIAFNYLVATELFDNDPQTTWNGELDWPGDSNALTSSGVTNKVTFGVVFVPGASFNNGDDKNIVVKIQASKDWTGNLDEIEIIWNI